MLNIQKNNPFRLYLIARSEFSFENSDRVHYKKHIVIFSKKCYILDMKNLEEIILHLNKKIKNLYSDFNGVYLYGSYATNNATENSDIDIVALFENKLSRQKRMDLWELIGKIEAETDVIFDLHPMTVAELEKNPLYYNQVVNKGIYYGI